MRKLYPLGRLALTGLLVGPAVSHAADPSGVPTSDLLDWLLSPLSGAAEHHLPDWAAWHARLMVLAWVVLIPLGVMAARFFKVTPHQRWPQELDNKTWWHAHRGLQYAGVAAMTVGLALAWGRAGGGGPGARVHAVLGGCLCLLGWLQVLGGVLRGSKGGPTAVQLRGDHFDMTVRRVVFEWLHKTLGYAALLVALLTVALGLVVADAPHWMVLTLGAWALLAVGAFVVLQRRGRCIDTYQAIWGPDSRLPGNRRAPIGWGVRRGAPANSTQ